MKKKISLLCLILAGCQSEVIIDEQIKINQMNKATSVLLNISDEYKNIFKIAFSDNGKSAAYIGEDINGVRVVFGDNQGIHYRAIANLAISQDGEKVVYTAYDGKYWKMVINNEEGESFDEISEPEISLNGKNIAYQGRKGVEWFIVVNNKKIALKNMAEYGPRFSYDSSKVFYVEKINNDGTKRFIVRDRYLKEIVSIIFTGHGVVFNDNKFVGIIEDEKDKQVLIYLNLDYPKVIKKTDSYKDINYVTLDKDGNPVLATTEDDKLTVIYKTYILEIKKGYMVNTIKVKPNSDNLGLILNSNDGYSVLYQSEDGKFYDKYDEIDSLEYSLDGRNYVYIARKAKVIFVVVNGNKGDFFDMVVTPVFSPDNRYIAYRARKRGKRFVVIADASTGKTIRKLQIYEQVFPVTFTEDGKSIAYGVKDGSRLIWKVDKIEEYPKD